jgi:hypothetical protein
MLSTPTYARRAETLAAELAALPGPAETLTAVETLTRA